MAEYKLYNLKNPKTGEEEPQVSSKEEFDILKQKVPTTNIKNPRTGQEGSAESVVKEDEVPQQNSEQQADAVNIAKEIGKVVTAALREHGDEMQGVFIKDMNTKGVTIKVTYKPDEQNNQTEDEFVFRWDNGTIRLDNVANPVDLAQIQNKSGRSTIQKDVLKDRLLDYLSSFDDEESRQPSDPAEIPDGTPVNEEEENLWESEDCQNDFCTAIDIYRTNKNKDSVKQLLKSSRYFKKGNTIQEKFKNAVDWYNWFTENPPKNTQKQVFLEDDDVNMNFNEEILKPLQEITKKFGQYINYTEDTWLGSYFSTFYRAVESLTEFCNRHKERGYLDEFWDVNDPIANGEKSNGNNKFEPNWEFIDDEEDSPVLDEIDEFGPEVGDIVDYEDGRYKIYGYCGYEVVIQNVDDDRDFKVVKPQEIGMFTQSQLKDIRETEYIDPEQLPDDQEEQI